MSDILCKWLNDDVKLSRQVCPLNLEESFANGFLIGELLSHYGVQENFREFSKSFTSEAIVNNFTRLHNTLLLLEINFDSNMAKQIIDEKPGIIANLLYELFIKLGKKCNSGKMNDIMVALRAHGLLKIDPLKTKIFKEHLRSLLPRQVDKDLKKLTETHKNKIKLKEEEILKSQLEEELRQKSLKQKVRQENLQKSWLMRKKQDKIMLKVWEATQNTTPQYPIKEKSMHDSIQKFEKDFESFLITDQPDKLKQVDTDIEQFLNSFSKNEIKEYIKPEESLKYVSEIRQRINENSKAKKEREKRRRSVLIEQFKTHQLHQDNDRDEALLRRLAVQTEMEKKIVAQLTNLKKEKEIMKNNRLELERQYSKRRQKEFQEALDREAEFCRLDKIKYAEEVRKQQEIHDEIVKIKALEKHEKHCKICKEIVFDIIDLVCKVGEYRQITENHVPAKVIRDWKTLFCNCKPLYEERLNEDNTECDLKMILIEKKQTLLDEKEFNEYKNYLGEWELLTNLKPADAMFKPADNQILGFILKRVYLLVNPPAPPPALPEFPSFPIKVCLQGKSFSGKSSVAEYFSKSHRVVVLNIKNIIDDYLQIWKKSIDNSLIMKNEDSVNIPNPDDIQQPAQQADIKASPPAQQADIKASPPAQQADIKASPPAQQADIKASQPAQQAVQLEDLKSASLREPQGVQQPALQQELQLVQEGKLQSPPETEKQLTTEAKLGKQIALCLQNGQALHDQLLVDVLLCKIHGLPEGTGWIIDGFPVTLQQAQTFENGLSGYVVPIQNVAGLKEDKKTKKFKLASDPIPPPPPKAPVSGLDIVIFLDVSDEVILKRAQGRVTNQNTGEDFHIEFKPPLESCYSKMNQNFVPVVDPSNEKEQILVRLNAFQANWSKLEKWFNQFNIVCTIDASVEQDAVALNVERVIEETMKKIQDLKSQLENANSLENKQNASIEEKKELIISDLTSSLIESSKPVFVDQPIDKEIAEIILNNWIFIEDTYIMLIKQIFRKIRTQCFIIDRYFYDRRDAFKEFLKKPDVKQIFITQWQEEYNTFPEDMRNDEECKAELHQRVDDLCERLWEISDMRKDEAEKELLSIIEDGWLQDNAGFLLNHYISLMQIEINRYQHTCYILREYYNAMEKDKSKGNPFNIKEFTSLPLLEISDGRKEQKNEFDKKVSAKSDVKKSQVKISQRGAQQISQYSAKEDIESNELEIKILNEAMHKALITIEQQKNLDTLVEDSAKKKVISSPKGTKKSAEKKNKKNKQSPTVETPILNEEEIKENCLLQLRKEEYQKAITIEGDIFKMRIESINSHGTSILKSLKGKADACYKDMDKWLGERFLQEMESIKKMCGLLKSAIESEQLLTNAIVLEGTDFYVDEEVKVFNPPVKENQESFLTKEIVAPSVFLCSQLLELCRQFKEISSDGFVSSKLFSSLISCASTCNFGIDYVAEKWKNLSLSTIEKITDAVSANTEYVNWKSFLLSISEPYPLPTAIDLKKALDDFLEIDQARLGVLCKTDYDKIQLWFDKCQPNIEISSLRLNSIRELFFEIFSSKTLDTINYTEMLLHFSACSDSVYGVFLALCIVTCQNPPNESFLCNDNSDDFFVSIDDLIKVLHFGEPDVGCGHRFNLKVDKVEESKLRFCEIFKEIGFGENERVSIKRLYAHADIKNMIDSCKKYLKLNILELVSKEERVLTPEKFF
ncbi:sperm flagellar protein 2 isoform X5 [Hydra vulgaris]|uniref:Sperm flagellar protein 2 isoform X5 n=1 Tax=Hydra vulgaris TaxID=6087 RepID=A0ABM4C874_HYDVU